MFNFNRMINLIKRQIIIQSKGLMWGLFGVIIGTIGLVLTNNLMIPLIPFIIVCFVGILSFALYSTPTLRAENILLPATIQEKYFANFIYAFIILPIIIIISIFIASIIGKFINFWIYDNIIHFNLFIRSEIKTFFNPINIISTLCTMSIFFFGALFFKKNRFLKTAVAIFVYFLITFLIIAFFTYIKQYYLFGHITAIGYYFPLKNHSNIVFYIISSIVILFFLILSYFRLKEERI